MLDFLILEVAECVKHRGQEEIQDERALREAEKMLNNHGNEGNHFWKANSSAVWVDVLFILSHFSW